MFSISFIVYHKLDHRTNESNLHHLVDWTGYTFSCLWTFNLFRCICFLVLQSFFVAVGWFHRIIYSNDRPIVSGNTLYRAIKLNYNPLVTRLTLTRSFLEELSLYLRVFSSFYFHQTLSLSFSLSLSRIWTNSLLAQITACTNTYWFSTALIHLTWIAPNLNQLTGHRTRANIRRWYKLTRFERIYKVTNVSIHRRRRNNNSNSDPSIFTRSVPWSNNRDTTSRKIPNGRV